MRTGLIELDSGRRKMMKLAMMAHEGVYDFK
jgi:hypothetical protein